MQQLVTSLKQHLPTFWKVVATAGKVISVLELVRAAFSPRPKSQEPGVTERESAIEVGQEQSGKARRVRSDSRDYNSSQQRAIQEIAASMGFRTIPWDLPHVEHPKWPEILKQIRSFRGR